VASEAVRQRIALALGRESLTEKAYAELDLKTDLEERRAVLKNVEKEKVKHGG